MVPIALAVVLSIAAAASPGAPVAAPAASKPGNAPNGGVPALLLSELVESGPAGLGPSVKARAHAGRRVRLVGFMAHMEEPQVGAFWLAPHPVECDEGGGGTGDLPPEAVRVVVRSRPAEAVEHLEGPIAVTGVLEVGNQPDAGGRVSAFRLLLDAPDQPSVSPPPKP
jgi:hypothetical protein